VLDVGQLTPLSFPRIAATWYEHTFRHGG
jgi:hypothetical protein